MFKDDLRSLGSDQLQHEGKISQEKKIWTEIGHLSGNFRRKMWIFAVNFLLIIKIIDRLSMISELRNVLAPTLRVWHQFKSCYLLICGCAVRLPHIFPLDLAILLLLLTFEQGLEGSLHKPLAKEMSSISES